LVHHVDLGVGTGFDAVVDQAGEHADVLVDYLVSTYDNHPDVPAVRLAVDLPAGERTWLLGVGEPSEVRAPAAEAVAWLTGRSRPAELPTLPSWL
jgi:hypothetical protein